MWSSQVKCGAPPRAFDLREVAREAASGLRNKHYRHSTATKKITSITVK